MKIKWSMKAWKQRNQNQQTEEKSTKEKSGKTHKGTETHVHTRRYAIRNTKAEISTYIQRTCKVRKKNDKKLWGGKPPKRKLALCCLARILMVFLERSILPLKQAILKGSCLCCLFSLCCHYGYNLFSASIPAEASAACFSRKVIFNFRKARLPTSYQY